MGRVYRKEIAEIGVIPKGDTLPGWLLARTAPNFMEKKRPIAVIIISIFIILVNLPFLLFPTFINSLVLEAKGILMKHVVQSFFGFHFFLSDMYNHMLLARFISLGLIILAVFLLGLNNIARILFIISQCLIILGNGFWGFILFSMGAGDKGHASLSSYLGLIHGVIVLSLFPIVFCVFFMLPKVREQFK